MTDPSRPDDRPAWLREGLESAPEQASGPAPGPASRLEPLPCYRHPGRLTTLRCTLCGRPVCDECATPAETGQLCPDHAQPVRSPVRLRRPVVTWSILGINGVLLLVEAALSGGVGGLWEPSTEALCRLGALNSAAIAESGQWWRLLTVMVLHAGVLHFALNSYALYLWGPALEHVLGRARYAAVYLVSGFTGSAASFTLNHTALGVGASGAIFGLLGALVAFYFRRRSRGGAPQLQSLLVIVVLNLVLGASIANIDNTAHVGGFLGGLAAMSLLEVAVRRGRLAQALAIAAPAVAGLVLVAYGLATIAPGGANCAAV